VGPRFDRRLLSKVKPAGLIRLARFINIDVKDCECDNCMSKLVELVVRKLDIQESWPPRLLERSW
jgi:hypothetical protein